MYTYYFEKLDVWKNSRKLTKRIYEVTAKFPEEEKFGLSSQLRRSIISITANIAEGMSRNTKKDKARFINQAYSTAWESINFIILAKDLDFITNKEYYEVREKLELITNQLNSLYSSIKN